MLSPLRTTTAVNHGDTNDNNGQTWLPNDDSVPLWGGAIVNGLRLRRDWLLTNETRIGHVHNALS